MDNSLLERLRGNSTVNCPRLEVVRGYGAQTKYRSFAHIDSRRD
jgi:hypothetical protein